MPVEQSTRSTRCCVGGPITSASEPTPRRSRLCIGTSAVGSVGSYAGSSPREGRDTASIPQERLEQELGLLDLTRLPRRHSWATS